MSVTIGLALLAVLVVIAALMIVAQRARAIPGQRTIDQADGTVPIFIASSSDTVSIGGGGEDCGDGGSDSGGSDGGPDGGGSCD